MVSGRGRLALFIVGRNPLQHCTTIEPLIEEAAKVHGQKRGDYFIVHNSATVSCSVLLTAYDEILVTARKRKLSIHKRTT